MRVVPYQEILEQKFKRQKELLDMGAQMHANGHCFHYGRISFGCRDCFTGEQSINCIHSKNKPPAMQVCPQTALASSKKPPLL